MQRLFKHLATLAIVVALVVPESAKATDRINWYGQMNPISTWWNITQRNQRIGDGSWWWNSLGGNASQYGVFTNLTIAPGSGLTVTVGPSNTSFPGTLYALGVDDASAYPASQPSGVTVPTLAADSTNFVLQALVLSGVTVTVVAGTSPGQSIINLIECKPYTQDQTSTTIDLITSTGTSGGTASVLRDRKDTLSCTTVASASSSSPTIPSPGMGYVAVGNVTVPYGVSSVTSGMISNYPGWSGFAYANSPTAIALDTTSAPQTKAGALSFSGGTLSGITLSGTTVNSGATISGGSLYNVTLTGNTNNASNSIIGGTLSGSTLAGTTTNTGNTISGGSLSGISLIGGTTNSGNTITGGTVSGATLSGSTLSGTTTNSGATITGGTISSATLSGDTLSGGTLTGGTTNTGNTISGGTFSAGTLTNNTLSGTTTNSGTISGGNFNGITLNSGTTNTGNTITGGTLSGATLTNPSLSGTMSGGTISGATLTNPSLSGTMSGGTISGATLTNPSLSGTMSGGTISGATLSNPSLTGTMSGGTISGATLSSPSLSGTMSGGTLAGTTLSGTILMASGATISGGTISGTTMSGGTLSNVTNSGTLTNSGTISGGTIANATLSGTTSNGGTISGGTLSGANLSGTTTNSGTISGGTVSGATLSSPTLSGTMTGGNVNTGTVTASGAVTGASFALPTGAVIINDGTNVLYRPNTSSGVYYWQSFGGVANVANMDQTGNFTANSVSANSLSGTLSANYISGIPVGGSIISADANIAGHIYTTPSGTLQSIALPNYGTWFVEFTAICNNANLSCQLNLTSGSCSFANFQSEAAGTNTGGSWNGSNAITTRGSCSASGNQTIGAGIVNVYNSAGSQYQNGYLISVRATRTS